MLAHSNRKPLAELIYWLWSAFALCRCGHPRYPLHATRTGTYCTGCVCLKFSRKWFRKVRAA